MTQTAQRPTLTDGQFELADRIELALEARTKVGTYHTVSQIRNWVDPTKQLPIQDIYVVLKWMEQEVMMASNGRGGCWRRYGRRK